MYGASGHYRVKKHEQAYFANLKKFTTILKTIDVYETFDQKSKLFYINSQLN